MPYIVARMTTSASDVALTTNDLASALKESNRAGSGYTVYEVTPVNSQDPQILEDAAKQAEEDAAFNAEMQNAPAEVTEARAQKAIYEAAVFDSRSPQQTAPEEFTQEPVQATGETPDGPKPAPGTDGSTEPTSTTTTENPAAGSTKTTKK